MHHWTVPIISVCLIFSYAISGLRDKKYLKLQQIGKDLKHVYKKLENSKYWKYHKGIKLYTASAGSADTCGKSILDCYVQELRAVLEEVNLIEELTDPTSEIKKKIDDISINAEDHSLQNGSCKKCEEHEEKSLDQFMEGFETLTQKMQNL